MRRQDAYGLADVAVGENNEWNELHYVSRQTFAQMAPSVLRLEIGRISRLIGTLPVDDDFRNSLVSARFRLEQLRTIVLGDFQTASLTECDQHLSAAILAVGVRAPTRRGTMDRTLDNIADRLGYVRERLSRLR
ncbi:MAG: hypothetical protein JJ896_00655 [Rhodothermales bacterium]|nr:hypothetical protein [Rhodothermales bacterium]MBO6778137.1 hypothetical protein [Rhodothermales bacterium]